MNDSSHAPGGVRTFEFLYAQTRVKQFRWNARLLKKPLFISSFSPSSSGFRYVYLVNEMFDEDLRSSYYELVRKFSERDIKDEVWSSADQDLLISFLREQQIPPRVTMDKYISESVFNGKHTAESVLSVLVKLSRGLELDKCFNK